MNKFDEMRTAVNEAKVMIRAADNVAHDMAALLRGRLRHVGSYVLADLKKNCEILIYTQKAGRMTMNDFKFWLVFILITIISLYIFKNIVEPWVIETTCRELVKCK